MTFNFNLQRSTIVSPNHATLMLPASVILIRSRVHAKLGLLVQDWNVQVMMENDYRPKKYFLLILLWLVANLLIWIVFDFLICFSLPNATIRNGMRNADIINVIFDSISDIDECLYQQCDVNAVCNNTLGSFSCACSKGFTGNGMNCTGENMEA